MATNPPDITELIARALTLKKTSDLRMSLFLSVRCFGGSHGKKDRKSKVGEVIDDLG